MSLFFFPQKMFINVNEVLQIVSCEYAALFEAEYQQECSYQLKSERETVCFFQRFFV